MLGMFLGHSVVMFPVSSAVSCGNGKIIKI